MPEPRWEVRRLQEPEAIAAILARDPVYGAYALGDLDPRFFPQTEWAAAYLGGEPVALTLLYRGLAPHPLLTFGDVRGLALILGTVQRAPEAYFNSLEEHLPAVEGFYALGPKKRMWRMVVWAERFRPAEGPAERLDVRDLADLKELYAEGDAESFTPDLLEQGVFYGVRVLGRLVAAAGTHLVSDLQRVGAVGNVYVHPRYRGQGLGTVVTSRVAEELLGKGLLVVLNVEEGNIPAIRAYERLGYERHCAFVECLGRRKTG
ncbi:MAG: GNAT family N-acetyltransferase [Anaerolineae bacterium]